MTLLEQLYLALRSMPCRCQLPRSKDGRVLYETESGERRVQSTCSRCKAIERYERETRDQKVNRS
jgi:hypothetical protein